MSPNHRRWLKLAFREIHFRVTVDGYQGVKFPPHRVLLSRINAADCINCSRLPNFVCNKGQALATILTSTSIVTIREFARLDVFGLLSVSQLSAKYSTSPYIHHLPAMSYSKSTNHIRTLAWSSSILELVEHDVDLCDSITLIPIPRLCGSHVTGSSRQA